MTTTQYLRSQADSTPDLGNAAGSLRGAFEFWRATPKPTTAQRSNPHLHGELILLRTPKPYRFSQSHLTLLALKRPRILGEQSPNSRFRYPFEMENSAACSGPSFLLVVPRLFASFFCSLLLDCSPPFLLGSEAQECAGPGLADRQGRSLAANTREYLANRIISPPQWGEGANRPLAPHAPSRFTIFFGR